MVPPHPVMIPDSNLGNTNLKLTCHMYRCSISFRIGWASSLCPNKPQVKFNNDLIFLQSMKNFENAELDHKEREKNNNPPHTQKWSTRLFLTLLSSVFTFLRFRVSCLPSQSNYTFAGIPDDIFLT